MERLKITLVGLVLVLTLVVAYGYGCGDSGDDGSGGDSVATEADGTGTEANGETTQGADGGEASNAAEEGDGDGGDEGDGESEDGESDGDGSEGGDGAGASGAPLSKQEYIQQGDAICQQVPARYSELVAELEQEAKAKKKPKPSVAETNLKAAVPPLPEAAKELEELVPPKGDEQEAEAIVAALEAAAAGLEEQPNSPLSGPKSPFDEFQKLTRKYGFKACSLL